MIYKTSLLLMFLLVFNCQKPLLEIEDQSTEQLKEINFLTTDRIQIIGDLYELDKAGATILLFHQGGSNARGEYDPIIPQLLANNFNVLAIDQRIGGQVYGHYNRTIAELSDYTFDDSYAYCDVITNLEGALDYIIAAGFSGPKILWGSSYSASLAIELGVKRPAELDRILAFSPASGGPMLTCKPDSLFEHLEVPLLICRPPSEMASEHIVAQLNLAKKIGHQTFVAQYGVHGSSMLVAERVGNDVGENWQVVLDFLLAEEQ